MEGTSMRMLLTAAALLCISSPGIAQQADQKCQSVDLKAPTQFVAAATADVNIRTGPGTNFPKHESGQLLRGEKIQILQECNGWYQARAIPANLIDTAIQQNGRARAEEMLLFWVRKDLVRKT